MRNLWRSLIQGLELERWSGRDFLWFLLAVAIVAALAIIKPQIVPPPSLPSVAPHVAPLP